MKGFGALACLFWLLATVGQTVQTLPEAAGQSFTYEFESTVLAGIPELADQYSGYSYKCLLKVDVVSKTKSVLRLVNVRYGKINEELPGSYEEDIDFQYTPSPIFEREFSKPFSMHYEDSRVVRIVTQKSDPDWSVNIKKAIAEKFQVDLKRQGPPSASSHRLNHVPTAQVSSPFYSVYEDGIGGECETRYSFQSVQSLDYPDQSEDVLNVTKVKNYRNCRSRPVFDTDNFEKQGSPLVCEPKWEPLPNKLPGIWRESSSAYESGCHFGFEPDFHPVKSYSIVWYNISGASHTPIIEGILAEGKTGYYYPPSRPMMVIAQMNATLVKKGPLRAQVPEIPNPVTHDSLEYQLPSEDYLDLDDSRIYALFGPVNTGDTLKFTLDHINQIVEDSISVDPVTSENVGNKILQAVKALSVLKRPELETLYEQIVSEDAVKVDRKEIMKKKVFMDILAIAASDEAALFARDLFVSKRIKNWEAAELFQGIGKNIDDPSAEVIEAYMKLLDRPRVQESRIVFSSVAITVGKMIEESCVDSDDPLPIQLQKKESQAQKQPGPRHPRGLKPTSSEEASEEENPKKYHPKQPQPPRRPQPPKQPVQEESQCNREQLHSYIQLLATKLQAAKTPNEKIILVEALTHMNTPEVLPYLKPYVTGDAPDLEPLEDEEADFLQAAVIYALHHLATYAPDEILPLVAGIYFDQSENYEIRIAAISVVLACHPPLTLLERVMTELHDETNNQVGSFVYDMCSEIANSSMPYERKLAQKLQQVLPHAPNFDIGVQYSGADIYSFYDDDDDYGLKVTSTYVASNVSEIPRSFFHSISMIRGPFRDNLLKVGGTIKGADEMIEKLFQPGGIASQIASSLGSNVQVRNIPEVLEVVKSRLLFKDHDTDIPRAFLYYKLFGRTTYMTVDEQYVTDVIEQALEFVRSIDISTGFSANYVKIWMPSSFIRVVPSTVGVPVMMSHRNPVILTVSLGNTRVSSNKKKEAPLTSAFALLTDLQVSVHVASIALASVFNPAHDQVHGAAIEMVTEGVFAGQIEVALNPPKDEYAVSFKPKLPLQIFSHDTRPSTYIAEAVIIGEPKDEWLDHVKEIETIPEPFKFDRRHEGHALGLSLRISGQSESPWADIPWLLSDTAESEGVLAALLELTVNPEMTNRELHVYLEPHRDNPASEIVMTFDYDTHLKIGEPKSNEENEDSGSDEEEYEKALSSIYGRSYAVPAAEATIDKLIQKTHATWAPVLGKGFEDPVPATITHVAEVTLAVKGHYTRQHAWRAVYAHSCDYRYNWFQLFGHSSSDGHEVPWQFCADGAVVYPQMPNPFYLEMNTLKAQQVNFHGEAGWGRNCESQNRIRVEGTMEKSEQQLTSSNGVYESEKDQQTLPWYYKQCQVDRTEGQTQSYACEQAISEDSQLNLIKVEINSQEQLPESLHNLTKKFDLWAKYAYYANLDATPFVSNPEGQMSLSLHYSLQHPDIPLIDVEVQKPSENLWFSKLYLPVYEPPSTIDSYDDVFWDQFYDNDYTPSCNLMEDYLKTFDNVTIELPDNKCQYILAHDSSPDKTFSIIASQIDLKAKTKALSMALAGHSIKLLPPRGEYVPIVLNGKQHEVSPQSPIVLDFNKPTELRLYTLSTSSSTDTPVFVVEVPEDGITVQYDGKNARIVLPREYQGDQVGLCGDYNDEEFQEFVGPNGCIYVEEEDFANSFAIPGQSCPEPPKPEGPAFCPGEVLEELKHNQPEPDHQPKSQPKQKIPPRVNPNDEKPTPKHPRLPPPQKKDSSTEESSEDGKPSGSPHCLHEYTPIFEDQNAKVTCFAIEPVHKCRPGCKALRPKPRQVPFHCLPESPSEKSLKRQAAEGPLRQLQNKRVERHRVVDVPEECV